jgi:MFS family permease
MAVLAPDVMDEEQVEAATPASSRRDRLAIPSLVTATTISNIGNNLTALAIPWFVLVTTGSAARTGVVAAAVALAVLLGGFFGGTITDRQGFKRVSIASDVASGFFVALVPTFYYLGILHFWVLLVLTFMASLLDAPGWSARRSMLPDLAARTATPLERANSILEVAQSAASFVGPLLAGVLIAAMSVASVLYLDTASFAFSAALIGLAIYLPHARASRILPGEKPPSLFRESTEGVRFAMGQPLVRSMMFVGVIANFLFTPMFGVAIPVYAKRTFDDPRAFGLLIGGFGIGAVLGVVAYGAIGTRVRRYPIFISGIIFGAACLWLLPSTPYLAVSIIGAIGMGIGLGPVNVITMTVIQEIVPRDLLGRVMGSLGAMTQIAAPIGLLIAGVAIEWLGVKPIMYFCATVFTLLIAAAVMMPAFRQLERGALTAENGEG